MPANAKKKSRLSEIPLYERDPRWPRFVKLLLQYQNATKAALDAGYAKTTATISSHKMAARVLEGLQGALWRKGMAVDKMADKLVKLFDAQMPKWNAGQKDWDYFEDAGTQLAAYDRIKTVLEPEPPRKLEIDVLVGVKRDDSRASETVEDWQARNQGRKRSRAQEGNQALIPTGLATQVQRAEAGRASPETHLVSNPVPVNGKHKGNGGGNL